MKTKISILTLLLAVAFISCEKYEGNSYDFSNSSENYVLITKKPRTPTPLITGEEQNYPFLIQTRTPFESDVKVSCEITHKSSGYAVSKDVVLPKGKIEAEGGLPIPATAQYDSVYVIAIKKAQTAEGKEVLLGRVRRDRAIKTPTTACVELSSADTIRLNPSDTEQTINFTLQTPVAFKTETSIFMIMRGPNGYTQRKELTLPTGALSLNESMTLPPVPQSSIKEDSVVFTVSISNAVLFKGTEAQRFLNIGRYEAKPKVRFPIIIKKS